MEKQALTGGEFLIKDLDYQDIFIPEEFNEEQKMIAQTCRDFIHNEVLPRWKEMDDHNPELMKQWLKKAGELGLLAISIPEEYEGFGQDFVTSMLASDLMGAGYSFSVAFSAHTGIGSLPIMYYGNEEQKRKYLPKLATGEWIGAYCLTEPGAGSDANSGTTRATLSEDGKYWILNGQKMWITNGGIADVYTVFAKIDNDRILSAFIVERGFEGISFGQEEDKMGIRASSTVQVFFNNCKVPVENLLGKRGEGFRIALNILNLGRIKLGANVIGASKRIIDLSVQYANERKQFRTKIANFGAIKYKLSEQVIRTFANESAVYRASQNIEDAVQMFMQQGMDKGKAQVEAQRKFAIEAAILKVYGSEAHDFVVDEAVQIHGGIGFSAEMEVSMAYRDSRINRIFEGTNEINRMVVADTMIKKGMKKEIALLAAAEEVWNQFRNLPEKPQLPDEYYERNHLYISNFKKATQLITKLTIEKYGRKFSDEQEILTALANMMIQLYIAESLLLRVEKLDKKFSHHHIDIIKDILDVFMFESAKIIRDNGLDALYALTDDIDDFKKALEYYTSVKPFDVKAARRRIADKLIEENRYFLDSY